MVQLSYHSFRLLCLATLAMVLTSYSCGSYEDSKAVELNYALIPQPTQLIEFPGYFELNQNSQFHFPEELADLILSFPKKSSNKGPQNTIELIQTTDSNFQTEEYLVNISEDTLRIVAASEFGLSRAIQSVVQLHSLNNGLIPNCSISDHPRFQHRGLLLDCCRHFFSVETIKEYIDLLAFYKMNVLHWHLTEDQAWRIQIDKYPQLTEVGAYRKEIDGSSYGGFYTKDDIREIVAYAESKHITIIPEIELPGHSQAAIASYPHLSCTGEPIAVANDWGVFKEIYCAGNDSVFSFLEDVLNEVVELFPSKYIHIGGDEAPKTRWESCPKCQKRIAEEELKDEHELQSYFIKRIQKFLKSKDRELIGWDEILEGGLAEGVVVQSWRGMSGGIEAAKHGNKAIMSPTSHAYFDYSLKSIDLKKVYQFDPIPKELSEKEALFIIGGECNMWTEHVPNDSVLDQRVFPRLLAMSEVLWTYPKERDFDEFRTRVQSHYPILDLANIQYGDESIPLSYQIKAAQEGSFVELTPYSNDLVLQYSINGSSPYPYKGPIHIQQSGDLTIQATKDGESYGEAISLNFDIHRGMNKEVSYHDPYSEYYTGGGMKALVDGKLGSIDFKDGSWQGFWGKDLECVIDMDGIEKGITEVSANFYQYNNSWIFLPTEMTAEISDNGEDWVSFGECQAQSSPETRGKFMERFSISSTEEESFRYLRLKAKNIGKVPDWHEAAGSDAWLFIDEISVK